MHEIKRSDFDEQQRLLLASDSDRGKRLWLVFSAGKAWYEITQNERIVDYLMVDEGGKNLTNAVDLYNDVPWWLQRSASKAPRGLGER